MGDLMTRSVYFVLFRFCTQSLLKPKATLSNWLGSFLSHYLVYYWLSLNCMPALYRDFKTR
jgi:hypothetical protein